MEGFDKLLQPAYAELPDTDPICRLGDSMRDQATPGQQLGAGFSTERRTT
jgi:hypothetical protein